MRQYRKKVLKLPEHETESAFLCYEMLNADNQIKMFQGVYT